MRYDFQIHNNYNELQECNIHVLGISTAEDRNSVTTFNFLLSYRRDEFLFPLKNIYESHLTVWQQMFY